MIAKPQIVGTRVIRSFLNVTRTKIVRQTVVYKATLNSIVMKRQETFKLPRHAL